MSVVETAADELYGLPTGDFIARRKELARAAKSAGDADAAREIEALRKPSTAAWMANLLARERRDDVAALLDLGAALDQAQQERDGERLRSLAGDRRRQLDALVRAGLELADRAGQSARGAVPTELRETLEAALGQSEVGEQLRTGRLTVAARPGAVGFGDWTAAVGPSTTTRRKPSKPAGGRARSTDRGTSSGDRSPAGRSSADGPSSSDRRSPVKAAPSSRSAARRRVHDAEKEAAEQQDAVSAALQQLSDDQAALDELTARLADLDEQRERVRAERTEATSRVRRSERHKDKAERDLATAQRALDKAQRAAK